MHSFRERDVLDNIIGAETKGWQDSIGTLITTTTTTTTIIISKHVKLNEIQ